MIDKYTMVNQFMMEDIRSKFDIEIMFIYGCVYRIFGLFAAASVSRSNRKSFHIGTSKARLTDKPMGNTNH